MIRLRHRAAPLLSLALVLAVVGCSKQPIGFPYAHERMAYPGGGVDLVRIHLGHVHDMRPDEQRRGRGRFAGITFPADEQWVHPVTDVYHDALARDITQTGLAELCPLPSQAAYVLESEIESFHCRLERPAMSFVLPVLAGSVLGFALGDDMSSRLKRTAVFGVLAYGALPVQAKVRAEVIVNLKLRDPAGTIVWERTCTGETVDSVAEPAASRRDRHYAEGLLPLALKRANACLLGQLRQFLQDG